MIWKVPCRFVLVLEICDGGFIEDEDDGQRELGRFGCPAEYEMKMVRGTRLELVTPTVSR